MTSTSKEKINWFYIIVGLFLLIGVFYFKGYKITESDLVTKKISLSRNIQNIHGNSRSASFYRLWANETKAAFKIDVPGGIASKWSPLDSLTKGDTLEIKYLLDNESELENSSKEIPIYSLQKSDRLYFDINDYNQSINLYDKRWNWITLILGGLLLLRGLKMISSKTSYIIGIISFSIIVILRILNLF